MSMGQQLPLVRIVATEHDRAGAVNQALWGSIAAKRNRGGVAGV